MKIIFMHAFYFSARTVGFDKYGIYILLFASIIKMAILL